MVHIEKRKNTKTKKTPPKPQEEDGSVKKGGQDWGVFAHCIKGTEGEGRDVFPGGVVRVCVHPTQTGEAEVVEDEGHSILGHQHIDLHPIHSHPTAVSHPLDGVFRLVGAVDVAASVGDGASSRVAQRRTGPQPQFEEHQTGEQQQEHSRE